MLICMQINYFIRYRVSVTKKNYNAFKYSKTVNLTEKFLFMQEN